MSPPDEIYPGVYIEELPGQPHTIAGVPTSIAAFVGPFASGALDTPTPCLSLADVYGAFGTADASFPLSGIIDDFFNNGGANAIVVRTNDVPGNPDDRTGIHALDDVDIFNLLCIDQTDSAPYAAAAEYCASRRAMLICDPPAAWTDAASSGRYDTITPSDLGIADEHASNAAAYFPTLTKFNVSHARPSGAIAGIIARTDTEDGVWKAPAGLHAIVNGATDVSIHISDEQNRLLDDRAINAIRKFPGHGIAVWGARTLRGTSDWNDDYKYIPIRRLALFLEESIDRGTQWAVFEPNAEPLWSKLRTSIEAFMTDLARKGAFYKYFVRCDATTTSQSDIDNGQLNIEIGFAPLKPAEFVIIRITQLMNEPPDSGT